MAKEQTLGENTIDSIMPTAKTKNTTIEVIENPKEHFQKQQKKAEKQRITVQISLDVIERTKNAVYWTPGLTLASLAEEAFSKAVDKLEKERKAPFPKRKEELKTGRPIN